MFAKVVIFCAALVAVNATALLHGGVALAHTGKSVSSRHQDAFGNYAFGYDIADGGASIKSRQEVGDAYGNKQGSYRSQINHIAPAAVPVAHAAPIAYAAPVAVAHRAPIAVAHSAPVAVAHAAPVAYSTSAAINHVAAPVYGAHVAHAAPLAVAHGAPVAYSGALNHVAAVPVARHVAAAPFVAGHGLAYSSGIVGHGLVAPHLGGIAYGGLKSVHY